ncbi:hypothetical protein JXI42_04330 [bacterium]|nr:hypothetical protein [bacterium]
MKQGAKSGVYSILANLNSKIFLEVIKVDIVVMFVGLFFIYGFNSELQLSPSRGLIILTGILLASVIQSQIITKNSADLVFYFKLPLSKFRTLAGFYLAFSIPALVIFTAVVFFMGSILMLCGVNIVPGVMVQRYLKAAFIILFSKSLTVNGMMAMKFHFAAIIGYFILLAIIASLIMIFHELASMVIPLPSAVSVFLFLICTYLISFAAIRKIEV